MGGDTAGAVGCGGGAQALHASGRSIGGTTTEPAAATVATASRPLYSNQHLFEQDWGAVTAAWLMKFPDPQLKQVSSVETVGRVVCEEQQSLHLRRLFHCTFRIPRLAERIFGARAHVICVEEAHWDMKRRRLTVHGRNETYQHILRIDEVCCYTEVEPGKTLYTQNATVTYRNGILSGLLMPVANELCAGICQRYAHAGTKAMVARAEFEAAVQRGEAAYDPASPTSSMGAAPSGDAPSPPFPLPALLGILAFGATGGWYALRRMSRPSED